MWHVHRIEYYSDFRCTMSNEIEAVIKSLPTKTQDRMDSLLNSIRFKNKHQRSSNYSINRKGRSTTKLFYEVSTTLRTKPVKKTTKKENLKLL
jgi:hypothetical protein